jgi:hypothetical protein
MLLHPLSSPYFNANLFLPGIFTTHFARFSSISRFFFQDSSMMCSPVKANRIVHRKMAHQSRQHVGNIAIEGCHGGARVVVTNTRYASAPITSVENAECVSLDFGFEYMSTFRTLCRARVYGTVDIGRANQNS